METFIKLFPKLFFSVAWKTLSEFSIQCSFNKAVIFKFFLNELLQQQLK